VEREGLRPHIRLGAEVTEAAWDEREGLWRIRLAAGEAVTARVMVSGWGQLNRPSTKGIAGVERFEGAWFHSARWNHDVALAGKRVAAIGNGPSAAQFIPEVAQVASHLTVFQRSPSYVVPRLNRPFEPEERRLFMAEPQRIREQRELIYQEHESWYGAMRLDTEKAAEFTAVARQQLDSQVNDPVLRERLWPDYPIGCKRMVIADDFYPAFNRPNVSLVTERIA
jgi:cation diffusion facilitator CzcD-associated flavoprotein CzcO